jgi:hypothetical protein
MTWCSTAERYVPRDEVAKAAGHNNVELSEGVSEVVVVGELDDTPATVLTKVDKLDQGSTEAAVTIEEADHGKGGSLEGDDRSDNKVSLQEVDMTQDPELLKRAYEFVVSCDSFSNVQDLADVLEIDDVDTMRSMALHSLANRLKKYFLGEGWLAGFDAAMKEACSAPSGSMVDYSRIMMKKLRTRVTSSREIIRNLKNLARLQAELIENNCGTDEIRSKTEATVSRGVELNLGILEKVFRVGDQNKIKSIRAILDALTPPDKTNEA